MVTRWHASFPRILSATCDEATGGRNKGHTKATVDAWLCARHLDYSSVRNERQTTRAPNSSVSISVGKTSHSSSASVSGTGGFFFPFISCVHYCSLGFGFIGQGGCYGERRLLQSPPLLVLNVVRPGRENYRLVPRQNRPLFITVVGVLGREKG